MSADANGKNKASLSLLVNLSLVIIWISSKSTEFIHLAYGLHMPHVFNLSWLRNMDFCGTCSSSKTCYNMIYLKSWNNCYYSNVLVNHTDFSTITICTFLTSRLVLSYYNLHTTFACIYKSISVYRQFCMLGLSMEGNNERIEELQMLSLYLKRLKLMA